MHKDFFQNCKYMCIVIYFKMQNVTDFNMNKSNLQCIYRYHPYPGMLVDVC